MNSGPSYNEAPALPSELSRCLFYSSHDPKVRLFHDLNNPLFCSVFRLWSEYRTIQLTDWFGLSNTGLVNLKFQLIAVQNLGKGPSATVQLSSGSISSTSARSWKNGRFKLDQSPDCWTSSQVCQVKQVRIPKFLRVSSPFSHLPLGLFIYI